MAKIPNVKIVADEEGDWECVYIDDTLAIEGHRIDARNLCRVLKLNGIIEFSGQRIEKPDDWFSPRAPHIYEE